MMNNVDEQYLNLLKDILDNGIEKNTRSGKVLSVFGRTIRFDVKDKLPILTTKKVFTKGIIHELLWFLSGSTNIKYLVDNDVHIWDDDAYRYFKSFDFRRCIAKQFGIDHDKNDNPKYYEVFNGEEKFGTSVFSIKYSEMVNGKKYCRTTNFSSYDEMIKSVSKEEFINNIKRQAIMCYGIAYGDFFECRKIYDFGELGPVYGKQWRKWNDKTDQIRNIIETLKTNPNDRRLIVNAWNANELNYMALPPCHYSFQFYTRALTNIERLDWLCKYSNGEYDEWKSATSETLDKLNAPKYGLSLMWNQRSVDTCLGLPFNIVSYCILLYLIAQCAGMVPDELICSLGDCHVYENHIEMAKEQLSRDAYKYNLPTLRLNTDIKNIDEFTYNDIHIDNYESYPSIKFTLSVG